MYNTDRLEHLITNYKHALAIGDVEACKYIGQDVDQEADTIGYSNKGRIHALHCRAAALKQGGTKVFTLEIVVPDNLEVTPVLLKNLLTDATSRINVYNIGDGYNVITDYYGKTIGSWTITSTKTP